MALILYSIDNQCFVFMKKSYTTNINSLIIDNLFIN
jgi:hypothetical protein